MRPSLAIPTALMLLAGSPALASSCSEEITTLQKRLDSAGARKVAGESQAGATAPGTDKALARPPATKPSDPDAKSTSGGVEEARSLVEKASAQDKAGDAEGCRDTILKAKEKAGALP
ncbi:hypothetical protein [Methylobacterium trifolii]|uniref:Uncharacterized protein n=1 Tax=Methylobacterium trifolii TaxID=1003092 RepID=A0ABQ4TWD1_9HYPH|nr:hypothetical protein [Methylobacterium trifolii]GJE58312.1 hypothetical protein MPOCJGCO_0391 [Methylobacterium trifolii]